MRQTVQNSHKVIGHPYNDPASNIQPINQQIRTGTSALYNESAPPATTIAPVGQPQPSLTQERTMLNIDSTDRDYALYPNPSKYTFKLPTPFRNVTSIRLLGVEVPASFYIFTAGAKNTTLLINDYASGLGYVSATIEDGNYSLPELAAAVQAAIQIATGNTTYQVLFNLNTYRMTIYNTVGDFTIDTATNAAILRRFWGLGYYLGFAKGIYSSTLKVLTAPLMASINPYNYILLDLGDDLNMIQEGDTVKGFFAKVPLNVNNFDYIYLTPECCSYNVAKYDPPIARLDKITVKWRFHDGREVQFNGFEHSFMLEIFTGEGRLSHPQINRITGAGSR